MGGKRTYTILVAVVLEDVANARFGVCDGTKDVVELWCRGGEDNRGERCKGESDKV